MIDENEERDNLPRELIDRLKAADRSVPMITSRVDREIADLSKAHFSDRQRPAWKPRAAWAAVAAAVVVALVVAQLHGPVVDEPAVIYADLDGSGRIDIGDVLQLAREHSGNEKAQADIDAFAMRIVSLSRAGETS